ncbi:rhomboid family intramembrane serine protease [Nocardia bovistercoris]|uniref:Rhomboid family intramembrane serine protease n=1 Tax=Nocardia bovistercoris TaxID=2785916 RepID=A0A931N380_9NOCA|nr:rhomboid family intramembrane serine protease [Nocardia bovistercoris]MBH0776856.1 rhomboid family intramembrane serine protease [Nocardia bovistercoris]
MTGGAGPGASFDPDRIAALRARFGNPGGAPPVVAPTGPDAVAGFRQIWPRAGAVILGFVGSLYLIEGVDQIDDRRLDQAGIKPHELDGLSGIVWAPVLHQGWDHLMSNTLPLLILGFLVLLSGILRGLAATAVIWVVAGLGTWLTGASGTVHIGASSLVFGWLTYLICRGWFARNVGQILIGLVVGAVYGSLLWGVLPGQPGISWQGHLFGAMGGVLAGWVLSGDARRKRRGDEVGEVASPR